ncbi:uncharacterized protein C10orf62 homolog [Erinaceus europaeus]|uniref:Uncharacterized protein C10orf62 homolog n=1 Tax=Erinaceus europaeus TaxID=9365 RepID=A0ABM3YII3_ERIEU|nr:uncharacterized protein C10orf62 homolog [Erinaceus europaeus]
MRLMDEHIATSAGLGDDITLGKPNLPKHEPDHPGSPTPSVPLALSVWRGVLEALVELVRQPSCKVVLGTAFLLGVGGLLLWIQREKRRKKSSKSVATEDPELSECHKAKNESWIKSHFSRFSEEKLASCSNMATAATSGSATGPKPDSGSGEANTTIRVETFTTKQEGSSAVHRESFTSKQRMSGTSITKETHRESGKSSATDAATWAAVSACTKEIDTKGRQLANSMLQRAISYQHSGHLETKDINQEELKALEEVEMKLKGDFLTQRETTVAGMNHSHTFHGHGHHSHQDHSSHSNHPSHASYANYASHHSHSLPSRSHQNYGRFEAT